LEKLLIASAFIDNALKRTSNSKVALALQRKTKKDVP